LDDKQDKTPSGTSEPEKKSDRTANKPDLELLRGTATDEQLHELVNRMFPDRQKKKPPEGKPR